jgi:hypothetical protein
MRRGRTGAIAGYVVTAATYAGILADLASRMIPHGVGQYIGYAVSLMIGGAAAAGEKGGLLLRVFLARTRISPITV